jgi:hypothetical protein
MMFMQWLEVLVTASGNIGGAFFEKIINTSSQMVVDFD